MATALHICIAFAAISLLVHFLSHVLALKRLGKDALTQPCLPDGSVSLVRPLCGMEAFSKETLSACFRLSYPRHEILFCVEKSSDPVIPLVQEMMNAHPHVCARLLIGEDRVSDNPKYNNMRKGYLAACGDFVVFADSNLLIPEDYLERVVATFQDGHALVSAPPFGDRPDNLWAEVECVLLNSYAARIQYCADALGFAFAQGKTLAFRKADLDAGAFEAMKMEPAEDAAATKWARKYGGTIRLVSPAFPQPLGMRPLKSVWSRHLRWARLRRATFPLLFAPEIFSISLMPFAAIWIAATLSQAPAPAWLFLYAMCWYGADLATARALGWPSSLRSLIALPMRDVLLLCIWIAAWTGRSFTWHGHAMTASRQNGPTA